MEEVFARSRVMVILRGFVPQRSLELAHRAWQVGIDLVEVPVQSERDLESLALIVEAGKAIGHPVGAGTIITPSQMRRIAEMGASFAVSPGLDLELVSVATQCRLPYLPGVGSATDVQRAVTAGLRYLKGFPATVLGTGWFRAMRGPFPNVALVATGGIDADNAGDFFDAGAAAVAVGSAVTDEEQLDRLAKIAA